jgi:hypothetical protein
MKKRIIFIDSRVLDIETLIRHDAPDTRYIILDANRSGIQQIQAALTESSELDAIHIISHGSAGTLTIGTTELNNQTLPIYENELAEIGNALTHNGDLLLYGCNIGIAESLLKHR